MRLIKGHESSWHSSKRLLLGVNHFGLNHGGSERSLVVLAVTLVDLIILQNAQLVDEINVLHKDAPQQRFRQVSLIHFGLAFALSNRQVETKQALFELAYMKIQFSEQQKHPKVSLLHQEVFQLFIFIGILLSVPSLLFAFVFFLIILQHFLLLTQLLLILDELLNNLFQGSLQQIHLQIWDNILLDIIEGAACSSLSVFSIVDI